MNSTQKPSPCCTSKLIPSDLSATDQEILHLSFFEGLSPAEITDHLNEPAERIRKRKSRARLRL